MFEELDCLLELEENLDIREKKYKEDLDKIRIQKLVDESEIELVNMLFHSDSKPQVENDEKNRKTEKREKEKREKKI
jgi:hypothetical protein